ncbi:MAG: protein kinase, partial [Bryobacteraceae bacterium]|nr:protein kinase [Bryobacteraceae bacterium]
LKPENIFLARVGGEREVTKVLDFGLATFLPCSDETQTLAGTAAGMVMGTPKYMSPEQASGGAAQPSWDLWALAVVTQEMLSARPVNTASGNNGQQARLEEFFQSALAPKPEQRPACVEEFLLQLRRALA